MTAGPFREVDFDLLADYVGGALDGTPDETTVALLVRDDPAWAEAYAVLAPAVSRVRNDLVGLGGLADPMPADVTERLAGVLASAALPTAPTALATPTTAASRPAARTPVKIGASRPPAVPTQSTGGTVRPPNGVPARRSRRRWSRLAGPVLVATAVLGLGGFGLSQLLAPMVSDGMSGAADSESEVGAPAPHAAGAPRAMLDPAADVPLTSGTDYTPRLLAVDQLPKPTFERSPGMAPGSPYGRTSLPAGLERLGARDALGTCLDEIAGEHARGPVTVDFLDYATFNGQPALVVRFIDRAGDRWAWVAGPECGVAGSGADTRYHSRVG